MPTHTVHTQLDHGDARPDHADLLQKAADTCLRMQHAPDASLTVVLADDPQLQALHKQFMGDDTPTDVLSFPNDDDLDGERYLGDIIISLDTARRQAAAGSHAVEDELRLLTIHGTLHLLGHDHDTPAAQAAMWLAQADVLAALGAGIRGPGVAGLADPP